MKISKRLIALALAGVLCVCALSGCQSETKPAFDPDSVDVNTVEDMGQFLMDLPGDKAVATVGGEEITAAELAHWIVSACDNVQSYYYYNTGIAAIPWEMNTDQGNSIAEFLLQEALGMAATQHQIEQKALEEGISITQEQKAAVEELIESIRAEGQEMMGLSLEEYMRLYALTPAMYTRICEGEALYEALADARFGEGTSGYPTQEDIRAYREEQGEYRVKHILLTTIHLDSREPLEEELCAQKLNTAQTLLAQLRGAKDPIALFDEYMNTISEDPGLETNPDGYVAYPGEMYAEFEAAALALEEGQISEVVETEAGYHLILRLPLVISLEEDREEYINTRMNELVEGWLEQTERHTTKEFDALDVQDIYERMSVYREKVQQAVADEPADDEAQTDTSVDQSAAE